MAPRVATTVWTISSELVLALDERLGTPIDSYVNGTQTWLSGGDDNPDDPGRGDAADDLGLEWRLHPVARYRAPHDLSHYDLWEQVVQALTLGADPHALKLADETRPLTSLWDGLECYAPYDDVEPAVLARRATELLGRAPDRTGLVDHDRVADAWERANGGVSIIALLLEQLEG